MGGRWALFGVFGCGAGLGRVKAGTLRLPPAHCWHSGDIQALLLPPGPASSSHVSLGKDLGMAVMKAERGRWGGREGGGGIGDPHLHQGTSAPCCCLRVYRQPKCRGHR